MIERVKWTGWIDVIEDDTLFCRLHEEGAPTAEDLAEFPKDRFLELCKDELAPDEIVPGLIFHLGVWADTAAVDGEVIITLPPRYTEEEIEEGKRRGAEMAAALRGLFDGAVVPPTEDQE